MCRDEVRGYIPTVVSTWYFECILILHIEVKQLPGLARVYADRRSRAVGAVVVVAGSAHGHNVHASDRALGSYRHRPTPKSNLSSHRNPAIN